MKNKKENKEESSATSAPETETATKVSSSAELKTFLQSIRDKMTDETAAPIYALAAINTVLNLPQIYEFLDNENKEIARDIWLRLKQAGLQVRNPPLLFGADEDVLSSASR